MIRSPRLPAALCAAAALSGCASAPPTAQSRLSSAATAPTPRPPAAAASISPRPEAGVSATVVPGSETYPSAPTPPPLPSRPGPVTLDLPGVDVHDFAKAVLGGVLGLPYAVDPAAKGAVTLVTTHPIARADVFGAIEDALKTAGLALELKGGVYTILPLDAAKPQAPSVAAGQPGFGNETLSLRYADPEALKKLLDPIVPGVITAADPATRTLVLSGSSAQRRSLRDLVQQFDVDWMKDMSFALFVPKSTDARLIAPELEKLINAPGSTTAGLVRLIAMEHLNGIIAIATRAQYLEDVRRWVEVLDREGHSSERDLYVYRVQNGRAVDLAQVLVAAFGGAAPTPSNGNGARKVPFGDTKPSGSNTTATNEGAGGGLAGLTGLQTLPGQSPAPVNAAAKGSVPADSLVITSDDVNNAIVAYATPREYALIERALTKLDITPLQVIIEASISEVTLNDALKFGTQWYFQAHGNQVALSQGTTATPVQNFPGAAYTLFSGGSIGATLNALSTVTHVQVLSAPNLLVLNNQTASLQVGDEVPISTGSAVSTVAAGAPVVNSIDYRDTGVILKVTPRVNSNGLVLLDISQEVSQVSQTADSNPIDSPVISERKIASSIAVQDGQTIALGGLISDNISKTRDGVPFLSAIPILGALAGSRNDTRIRTELLVLLTPRVIRNSAEALAATDELKAKIRVIEPMRPRIEP